MSYLQEHEDSAIGRESLLRDVWGHKYDVGSNVVDVVVRALQRKLGQHDRDGARVWLSLPANSRKLLPID
jgi:DNA-binding response OmpR family regulator